MEQKRQFNIDLLRILACFMVLVLHVSSQNWRTTAPESSAWQVFNFYDVVVRSAALLFFMISGKLFLARDDICLKKLFSKNILKLVLIYILWALIYAVDTLGLDTIIESRNFSYLLTAVADVKYHLWYIPTLISLYLLVPVFISMKSYKNGKMLDYAALVTFVFSIIRFSIRLLPINQAIKDFFGEFNFAFDAYCCYFLFGYVIDKYKEKFKKIPSFVLIITFIVTVVLTTIGSYFLSVKEGAGVTSLYHNFFISSFIEAAIIFILFLRLKLNNVNKAMSKVIKKVSAYTLFVYLFHPYLLEHLNLWFGLNTLSFAPIISVPVLSVLLFILCMAIAFVLDRIPIIRKIFI